MQSKMTFLLLCSALWVTSQSRFIDNSDFLANLFAKENPNFVLNNGSYNSTDNFLVFSQSNKLLTNGSEMIYNFTLIDKNNRTLENNTKGHVIKRVVEDSSDFEVETTSSSSMHKDNTTEPKFGDMAQQVANELSSGMLLGNGFFMERLVFEDRPEFAPQKRSVNLRKDKSPFSKGSKLNLNNPFASIPRFILI